MVESGADVDVIYYNSLSANYLDLIKIIKNNNILKFINKLYPENKQLTILIYNLRLARLKYTLMKLYINYCYRPLGPGYFKAKKHFENLIKN